jgi:hypothetical protein
MMCIAVPGCCLAAETDSHGGMAFAGVLFFVGFFGFVIGRFME